MKQKVSPLKGKKFPNRKISESTRIKMRNAKLGKKRPKEVCKKISLSLEGNTRSLGYRHPEGFGDQISERQKGEKHWNWQNGKAPKNQIIRASREYKNWRKSVFERDDYTCIFCSAKSKKGKQVELNADHIKPFAYYKELRFDINNGRTLCVPCHKKTDTYMGRASRKETWQ